MVKVAFTEAIDAGIYLTFDNAYQEVRDGYLAVRQAAPEEKLSRACELIHSLAFDRIGVDQPWFAVDIGYASMENLHQDERPLFGMYLDDTSGCEILHDIYPQAAKWYYQEKARLCLGNEHNEDRREWQTVRRTVLGGLAKAKEEGLPHDTLDTLSRIYMEKLVQLPVLAKIAEEAPWSALDVYAALADTYPEDGRHAFAEKYLLGSSAYAAVQQDCPRMAAYYAKRVDAMRPASQAVSMQPDAGVAPV